MNTLDKYEYKVRVDEIKELIARGEYSQAAEIADTIDWRRVKSVMMLCIISDLYKINRRYEDARDILYLAYERRPGGKTICYSLCELCIKTEDFLQAVNFYKEFVQLAPKDPGRYVLQYKIYEAQDVSLEERIGVLEELKKRDYREKWAYELAYLYHRVGLATRCVEECDELILWFGEGKYVIKAMELKMLHEPLTDVQQEKYNHRFDKNRQMEVPDTEPEVENPSKEAEVTAETETEADEFDIHVKTVDVSEYNTINLQAELAEGLKEVLAQDLPSSEENTNENSDILPDNDTESLDFPEIDEVDESDLEPEAEVMEESEVFFGETGDLGQLKTEIEEQVVVEKLPDTEIPAEPPKELANVLSQESDGQIRLVMPENHVSVEKQITGQMNIEDILAEWERMKKENEEKRKEEVRQHVLQHTGAMFTEFEAAVRDGLLEQLESGKTVVKPASLKDKTPEPVTEEVTSQDTDIQESVVPADESKDSSVEELYDEPSDRPEEETVEEVTTEEAPAEDDDDWFDDEAASVEESADETAGEPGEEIAIEETVTEESISEEVPAEETLPEEVDAEEDVIEEADAEENEAEEDDDWFDDEGAPVEESADETVPEEVDAEEDIIEEAVAEENEAEDDDDWFDDEAAPVEKSADEAAPVETEALEDAQEIGETAQEKSTTSERVRVRSLTKEEEELYTPFIRSRTGKEKLIKAVDNVSLAAYTGNIVITGDESTEPLALAKNMIRELQMTDSNFSGKVAKVSGRGLNTKDIEETLTHLSNGALIIEKASEMKDTTIEKVHRFLQQENLGIVVTLIDTKKSITKMFEAYPELKECFTARVDLEAMSNEMLVEAGKKYAREMEYSIDDLGILAFHTRIEELQTSDHAVSVAEAKEIVDEAIEHANRKTPKHFFDILLGKRYDDEDMIILTERDFV